jgi:hypothetical protein
MILDLVLKTLMTKTEIKSGEDIKGIVLIDEIDSSISLNYQRLLVPAFTKTFPNVQFVTTTHSPFLIQSMRENNVINLKVMGNSVVNETPTISGKLTGYSIPAILNTFLTGRWKRKIARRYETCMIVSRPSYLPTARCTAILKEWLPVWWMWNDSAYERQKKQRKIVFPKKVKNTLDNKINIYYYCIYCYSLPTIHMMRAYFSSSRVQARIFLYDS